MIKFHEPPFKLAEIKLEVTHRCSLACIHCSSDASSVSTKSMDVDKCIQIISQAAQLGVTSLSFSGGEPLLWEGIESAAQKSVMHGINTTVYTTGNVNNIDELLGSLKRIGISKCIFSVFSSDEYEHEKVTRIAGSFAGTKHAITLCGKLGVVAEIHFVPLSSNYKELKNIAELARQWKVKRVSVLRFVPQGRGYLIEDRILDRSQNLILKKMIEDLRKEGHDIRTGSPYNFLLLNEQPKCASGIDRLIVSPDYRIFPCDAFKGIDAEEIVSPCHISSLDVNTLADCWDRSEYLTAVRTYLTTDFAEPCNSCKLLEKCLSGCLAQKVLVNRDLRKSPDPMCLKLSGSTE